jgi:2-aminoadipate transaminase
MELAAKVLLEPGDVVFVGLPTYFGGTGACKTFGAELVGVPLDDDGMNPEVLAERIEAVRSAGKTSKLIYVIPDFQNPTGATLPVERRRRIVELANTYDLAIVEDNPYRNLCFTGEPLPPIKSFDTEGRVVCLRSFSKIFCPGFRLAFAIGEKDMIRKMVIARQFEDCCSNVFAQHILLEFISRGLLEEQIEKNRQHYKKKRDALLGALDEHFPDTVRWNRPDGGFFVFVHLPEGMCGEELLRHAVDRNVAFVAGAPFYIDGSGKNTFRLSYAQSDEEAMKKAVAVLGRLIKEQTAQESEGTK